MSKMEMDALTQVAAGMDREQQEVYLKEFSTEAILAELGRRMEYMENIVLGIIDVVQEKSTADG